MEPSSLLQQYIHRYNGNWQTVKQSDNYEEKHADLVSASLRPWSFPQCFWVSSSKYLGVARHDQNTLDPSLTSPGATTRSVPPSNQRPEVRLKDELGCLSCLFTVR